MAMAHMARIVAAKAAQRKPMLGRKADMRASRRRGSYTSEAWCATTKKEEKQAKGGNRSSPWPLHA